MAKVYQLQEKNHGVVETLEHFDNFSDLKQHLIEEDYFGWISDNAPNMKLPNFERVDDVEDIERIFDNYGHGWWTMSVEIVDIGDAIVKRLDYPENGYYIERYKDIDDLLVARSWTYEDLHRYLDERVHMIVPGVPVIVYENPGTRLFNLVYITNDITFEEVLIGLSGE